MSAPKFEVIRHAGVVMRPARSIGSGLKSPINAGACVCVDGIHFATVEPRDQAHAGRIQAATETIRAALLAAGFVETVGAPK